MPNPVSSNISNFSRTVALMPIGGNEYPAVSAYLRKKSIVGGSDVGSHILFVDAVTNPGLVEFGLYLRTVPIFIEVESITTLPLGGGFCRVPIRLLL